MQYAVIEADLILLHPPSVYDFRERSDVLFAYLSNSDSVAVSPIYEIYPLGFKSLEAYLSARGFRVRIINLAALMLRKPDLDVPAFLGSLRARLIGLDLHWVCHAHGGLAIAALSKKLHPEIPIVFGGISATWFASELIAYDQVDMVMRGYDTHEPLHQVLCALRDRRPLTEIPNLIYKDASGAPEENAFSHVPRRFSDDCAADWSSFLETRSESTNPAMMFLPSSGCAHNCGWCGGSRDAVRRIMGSHHTVASKPVEAVEREMASMRDQPASRRANIYTLNAYNFGRAELSAYLEGVSAARIGHVSYEQFHLTRPDVLKRMVAAAKTTIHLSPESHDLEISRLAGRGVYTMEEMEEWIDAALKLGVWSVNIWFFIGMPTQTVASLFDTVEYCKQLLERFRGKRVYPLLCPMVPFLDPGSTFFEQPEQHGYRIFFRSLEDHRQALVHPSWLRRLNYETTAMSRSQLVTASYDAVRRLSEYKRSSGALPAVVVDYIVRQIDEAKEFVFRVDDAFEHGGVEGVVGRYGERIRRYNQNMFQRGTSDQLYPIPRSLDNRWFDEFERE